MNDVNWLCTDGTSGEGCSKEGNPRDLLEMAIMNKVEQGYTVILSPSEQFLKNKGWDSERGPVRVLIEPYYQIIRASGWASGIDSASNPSKAFDIALNELEEGIASYYT